MIRSVVDGMRLDAPLRLSDVPPPSGAAVDWTLEIEHASAPLDESAGRGEPPIAWTGDVRADGRVWARFGRRGPERIVSLLGVVELCARPDLGRARLRHDRGPSWDAQALRRASPYLAALLGRTALHAASVLLPAGVVLLCADTGTGKSTLALALDAAGRPVLGDDHVVVETPPDAAPLAHPSFPFAEVASRDGEGRGEGRADASAAGRAREKAPRAFASPRPSEPSPIVAVAFLERGALLARTPIPRADALARLLRDVVFVADPADDPLQLARLDACVALLTAAPPVRLVIPDDARRVARIAADVAALWSGRGP